MPEDRYKYPRTPHLPWSPGFTPDDKRRQTCADFAGMEVVVTEKFDGENTTLYRDGMHARSLDGRHHPSRDWVKQLLSRVSWQIPHGWRVCGENMYARHSVVYDALQSYFLTFSVWDNNNCALSWDDTVAFANQLGLATVPVIWRGAWDEARVSAISVNTQETEGYVVRNAGSFPFADFQSNLAKWVRKNHVQTDQHWMHAAIVPNGLADE